MIFHHKDLKDNYGDTTAEREANFREMRGGVFSPFEIILRPLKDRESRVIPYTNRPRNGKEMSWSRGTCYRAHSFAIAVSRYQSGEIMDYVLLAENGSGRNVLKIPAAIAEPILDILDETNQFRAMYSLHQIAQEVFEQGESKARNTYSKAFIEKRLKKRTRNGYVRVEVLAERILPAN